MEVNEKNCTTTLHDQFVYWAEGFSQAENISKLTTSARGTYKGQCMKQFYDNYTTIKEMLDVWATTEKPQPRQETKKPEQSSSLLASISSINFNGISWAKVVDWLKLVWSCILWFFVITILWGLFIRMFKKFI